MEVAHAHIQNLIKLGTIHRAHPAKAHECLETGPPLQNLMWSILVLNRLMPVVLTGDHTEALLEIRI